MWTSILLVVLGACIGYIVSSYIHGRITTAALTYAEGAIATGQEIVRQRDELHQKYTALNAQFDQIMREQVTSADEQIIALKAGLHMATHGEGDTQ
jgi:hypothetical protein